MARAGGQVLTRPAGAVTGRAAVWTAIRERRAAFTAADLQAATGEPEHRVFAYLAGLARAGFIVPTGLHTVVVRQRGQRPRQGHRTVYQLVRDCGVEPPRVTREGKTSTVGLGAEQLWRTMRMLGHGWTIAELASTASTAAVPVSASYTKHYVGHLVAAGYVAQVQTAAPGRPAKYRFVRTRDTGPKPPTLQRRGGGARQVYDANIGRVVRP